MTVESQASVAGRRKKLPWNPFPHMNEYLRDLELNGVTDDYVRANKAALSRFNEYMHQSYPKIVAVEDLRREHFLGFKAHLDSLGFKESYIWKIQKNVKGWVMWMIDLDYITTNPWTRIRIHLPMKQPKPIEDEEVEALFNAHKRGAFSLTPFSFHRREVILVLLYGWGLRIIELHSLNLDQMDLNKEFVRVYNKGGGYKTLPFNENIKNSIRRYLSHRASHAKKHEDALLVAENGHRLGKDSIRKIVSELGNKAGIHINPHRLRDTYGTQLLNNGVELERVMRLMGHSNPAQTLAYSAHRDETLARSHQSAMGASLKRLLDVKKQQDTDF